MTVIGITGPSGAGKGALSSLLNQKYGFPVIDADKVYHSLVSAPSECVTEIRRKFGDGVIVEKGAIDRRALGKIVLGEENREKLAILNKITHKYVVEEIMKSINDFDKKDCLGCIVDAPLLIEAGLVSSCDMTFAVLADRKIRAERISARDGISVTDAMRRIDSQKSDDFYIQNTDHTLINNSDLNFLFSSVREILLERRVIE